MISSPAPARDCRIGPVHRAGPFRIRSIEYPPGMRQPPHDHDHFGMTVVLAGEIRESTRWGEEIGSALSVVVKPAGVTHADEIGPHGANTLQVAFDAVTAQGLAARAPIERWRWLHGGLGAAPFVQLARALGRDETDEAELEDRVFEAITNIADPGPAPADPPAWLGRVKEALDDEPEAAVTVHELARMAGVHPVSVSRSFRRHYGHTITEYRRRARLRRAAASIARSRVSLSRTAHEAGYADHAHLCREFRRAIGLTPSEFRAVLRC
jgi:AraC family transcriptional regulator